MIGAIKNKLNSLLSRSTALPRLVTDGDLMDAFDEFEAPDNLPDDWVFMRHQAAVVGLPVRITTRQLLDNHKELLSSARNHMGVSPENYRNLILPVICRFARYVHLLPASENHHHRKSGGLLQHSLEVASHAVRASLFHSFSKDAPLMERTDLDAQWRVAAFLAGLFHDVAKCATDMEIVDETGQHKWSPFAETIGQWSKRHDTTRYFVKFKPNRVGQHVNIAAMLMPLLVHTELKAWLSRGGFGVLNRLGTTLGGGEPEHAFAKMITQADAWSVGKDIAGRKVYESALEGGWGASTCSVVIDMMCTLLSEGAWTVNERGSRVWVLKEGVFIVWNQAIGEVRERCMLDGVKGLPNAPEIYSDMFLSERLIEKYEANGESTVLWTIAPDVLMSDDGRRIRLKCAKLTTPDLIFRASHGVHPAAIAAEIGPEGAPARPTPEQVARASGIELQPVGPATDGAIAPMFNLDTVVEESIKPHVKATLESPAVSRRATKGSPIELVPVDVDELINDLSVGAPTPPREQTGESVVAAAPMFALDDDDSLFTVAPPVTSEQMSAVSEPVQAEVSNEISNADAVIQPTAQTPVASVKTEKKRKRQAKAEVPPETVAAAAPANDPVATFFQSSPEIAATIKQCIHRGQFYEGRGGRAFLPLADCQFSDADETHLLKSGWLARDPARPGQLTSLLSGMPGYTFEFSATDIITRACGEGGLKKIAAQKPKGAKQKEVTEQVKLDIGTNAIDLELPLPSTSTPDASRAKVSKAKAMKLAIQKAIETSSKQVQDEIEYGYLSWADLKVILLEFGLTKLQFIRETERMDTYQAVAHLKGLRFRTRVHD